MKNQKMMRSIRTPKPGSEINGKMGDIGGNIVAAASCKSGRFRSKENGQEKETPKSLKSSKKMSESFFSSTFFLSTEDV